MKEPIPRVSENTRKYTHHTLLRPLYQYCRYIIFNLFTYINRKNKGGNLGAIENGEHVAVSLLKEAPSKVCSILNNFDKLLTSK